MEFHNLNDLLKVHDSKYSDTENLLNPIVKDSEKVLDNILYKRILDNDIKEILYKKKHRIIFAKLSKL